MDAGITNTNQQDSDLTLGKGLKAQNIIKCLGCKLDLVLLYLLTSKHVEMQVKITRECYMKIHKGKLHEDT